MRKILFLVVMISLFIIQVSQAVTISPSIINQSLSAGSSTSFETSFIPDPPEISVTFSEVGLSGDCSDWIAIDRSGFGFTERRSVQGVINVPANAVNGWHRCDITFISPATGLTRMAIALPIVVQVTGGIEPTPTVITTVITIPTTVPTTEITTGTPTPKPTRTERTTRPTETPTPTATRKAGIEIIDLIAGIGASAYLMRRRVE